MASKLQHKCTCSQPNLHIILLIIVYFAIIVKMYHFGNFVDLAYSEHEETEMLTVFTYANELGFEPDLNSPELEGYPSSIRSGTVIRHKQVLQPPQMKSLHHHRRQA